MNIKLYQKNIIEDDNKDNINSNDDKDIKSDDIKNPLQRLILNLLINQIKLNLKLVMMG